VLRVALHSLIGAGGKLQSSQDKVKAKNGLWSGQFRNLLLTKRIQELTVSDFLSSRVPISDTDITGQMPGVANEINCFVPPSVHSTDL
jgi:hypothetical protein